MRSSRANDLTERKVTGGRKTPFGLVIFLIIAKVYGSLKYHFMVSSPCTFSKRDSGPDRTEHLQGKIDLEEAEIILRCENEMDVSVGKWISTTFFCRGKKTIIMTHHTSAMIWIN